MPNLSLGFYAGTELESWLYQHYRNFINIEPHLGTLNGRKLYVCGSTLFGDDVLEFAKIC